MIKLKIKTLVNTSCIESASNPVVEKVIDYNGTYDGKFLTYTHGELLVSWCPYMGLMDGK